MATSNGNGWKNWALAGMTGMALGGGIGTYTGARAASDVKLEMEAKIDKLETRVDRQDDQVVENQLRIVEGIGRLEEQVKYIRKQIDGNAQ